MALHVIDKIVVEDEGVGTPVVCLHGLGGSSNTWTPLMGALAGHRVVRIDLPGSGRSCGVGGPLSIARLADAVVSVCTRLAIARAHFVGHSMGTIVCQHLAVDHPKLVRSLVLFGPLIAPPDPARAAIRNRAAKVRAEGLAGLQDVAQTLMMNAISNETRDKLPSAAAFVRESLMRQDPEAYARSCDALADTPPAAVERIEAPALLVTGDEDTVAPPQAVRAMAERMQGSRGVRVSIYGRCGHWTPIERSQDCARELRAFIAAQRS
ncbi:MAG: alpha/beta fold hydrolase [Proteobacteria bacterium]|nr:alpha/beta fold hydrolase [Pseudomonadota bacterium]